LGEQEAAAVADVGIVDPELMAVIAQRQLLLEVLRQPLETAEMADPLLVAQAVQPDFARLAVVAEAQDRLREFGRRDRIVEIVPELKDSAFGPIEAGVGRQLTFPAAVRRSISPARV
jgi:hypothetical protein